MNRIKLHFIILLLISLNSCEGLFNCLDGNGVYSEETRGISSFTSINNTSGFDVVVIYDKAATSLSVEADENLQQYIKTYTQKNSLVIESDRERCLSSVTPIKITVKCPVLERAVLSGSGSLDVYNFSLGNFSATVSGSGDMELNDLVITSDIECNISGSGDLNLDGKGNSAVYTLTGSGDLDADRFKVDECSVTLSGSGDISVNFISSLTGLLSGSGNIRYYGDPGLVKIRTTGSGKVLQE